MCIFRHRTHDAFFCFPCEFACVRLTVDLDVDVCGPSDRVTLSLTAVSPLILEVQLLQAQLRLRILLLRPLQDRLVPVHLPPEERQRVAASRGPAGQSQSRAALRRHQRLGLHLQRMS